MQRIIIVAVFIVTVSTAKSQQLSKKNITGKQETEFAFRVKNIDEFFDRFNAKRDIFFLRYIKKTYPDFTLTRPLLINSLVNKSNIQLLTDTAIQNIITEVTDSLKPRYLNFVDSKWFALLKCSAFYKNKAVKINLTLRVDYHRDGSSEWALYDADAAFMRQMNFNPDSFLFENNLLKYFLHTADSIKYSLHPMSHALDFMNIDQVFTNQVKFINYTYQSRPSATLKKLFIACINNQFRFVQVDSIEYYMLQLPGRIIKVEEFNRSSKSSGWLINDIQCLNDHEKYKYFESATRLNIQVKQTKIVKGRK